MTGRLDNETEQQEADRRMDLSSLPDDTLRTLSHDLRDSFNVINVAAHLLNMKKLPEAERVQFMEVLGRNLTQVEPMLDDLNKFLQTKTDEKRHPARSVAVIGLMNKIHAQLPKTAPDEFEERIDHVRRIIERLLLVATTSTL